MPQMLTIPLPKDGVWTLDAYHALPEDLPVPVDLVDGVLRVNAKPVLLHNDVLVALLNALRRCVPPEWRVGMEVDVLLSSDPDAPTEVAPDVIVYSAGHDRSVRPVPAASVLLVVEVVSPGSTRKDRLEYPWRYAEAGISHYWRVETPLTSDALRVHTFALQDGVYVPTGEFTDRLELDQPFPVAFEVPSLLA